MDLAHVRAHPQHLPTLLRHQRIRETPVPGGDICAAARLTLDDGGSLFAKSWPGPGQPPPDYFATEAAGLRWLAEPGSVPVPEVVLADPDLLVLSWVEPGPPSAAAADRFGRGLAELHRSGAAAFGAPWPGYLGRLPQPNTESAGPWGEWFGRCRLAPHLRTSVDRAALSSDDAALVERVIARADELGGDEPPARIHGDLWPGNLLWGHDHRGTDAVWLVDPAAHGGHRETDLATLALFGGPPYPERILAAYQEEWPLADGWRERRPLHQLALLLVHTATFGAGWRDAVVTTARAALTA